VPYPCGVTAVECTPGTSISGSAYLGGMFGPVQLQGKTYVVNANWGPGYLNLHFVATQQMVVPSLSRPDATATLSTGFVLADDSVFVAASDLEGPAPVHHPLLGSGTVTYTFSRNVQTPDIWWISKVVYEFAKK
jgi:hypothetical protein